MHPEKQRLFSAVEVKVLDNPVDDGKNGEFIAKSNDFTEWQEGVQLQCNIVFSFCFCFFVHVAYFSLC